MSKKSHTFYNHFQRYSTLLAWFLINSAIFIIWIKSMWIKDCPCMQQQIRALFMHCNVSTQEVNERNLKPIYFTGQWTRVLPRKKSRPVNCSQSTSSLVLLLASSSLEATNFSVLFVWLPGPDTPRPGFAECCCWKKTGTTVFQFCVLIAAPLWCTLMMLYYSGVNTR